MAGLNRLQYVGKDHANIVADCVEVIKNEYPEKWNDFYEDNAGMMLVEAFAYVVDLLLYYLERQANETYLPTASERQNLLNMCKLVAYRASNARPAEAELVFSLGHEHSRDVTIPAGTVVSSSGGVLFETREDVHLPAGTTTASCYAVEGETFDERIGRSDGAKNQEYLLPRATVIEIERLTVGGTAWEAVDSLAEQTATAAVYMVDVDAFGRARILFGDGASGRIPQGDAEIRATYRVGGGIRGNVAAGMISLMRDIVVDEAGDRVSVEVTNPLPAAGGADAESIERIKRWAPRYFEAQDRCVTQADYETVAMTFDDPNAGAIAKARAVVRERSGEANVIRYYVLTYAQDAKKLGYASPALKAALLEYVNKRKMFTDWIEIEDGAWRNVDVRGTVRIVRGYARDKVLRDVKAALTALLNVEVREMGEALRISDVYAAIDNVEGVIHVELETPTGTIEAETNEILMLGDMNFVLDEGAADGTNF